MDIDDIKRANAAIERFGGCAWSYEVTWRSGIGRTTIRGGYYATHEEALAAKWRSLDAAGYVEPKWWEFWRHDEPTRKRDGLTPPRSEHQPTHHKSAPQEGKV